MSGVCGRGRRDSGGRAGAEVVEGVVVAAVPRRLAPVRKGDGGEARHGVPTLGGGAIAGRRSGRLRQNIRVVALAELGDVVPVRINPGERKGREKVRKEGKISTLLQVCTKLHVV